MSYSRYLIISLVEVFDRLMCSLGQDCLDSLYWNTVSRPYSSRMVISFLVVVVYTAVHSLILLVHVETLSVAMNSADEALMTLLITGNFAEIKSTVFKKYNKAALFKITVSDICERFKLSLFISLVILLNFCQGMDGLSFDHYVRMCGIVWGSEILADWIKHAFVTKFNFLPARVYPEYSLLLAGDVTGFGHEGFNLDHSHAVVKRMGFAQIPLVCVMFRLLREAVKYAGAYYDDEESDKDGPTSAFKCAFRETHCRWLVGFVIWLLVLSFKLLLGRALVAIAWAKLRAAPELTDPLAKKNRGRSGSVSTSKKTN
jgi:Eukaryotic membrane protein family